jgi:hypothetical protein
MKFKWYYIAIPVGLVLAYLLFSGKSTILRGKAGTNTSGAGGILAGIGSVLTGGSKLWDSVDSSLSSSNDSTSETAE